MFEIKEGDLPFVRTGRALLVLDLQNDLVSSEAVLYVDKPPNFLNQIINLAGKFRNAGNIIWVRSEFEVHRPINTRSSNAEMIITDTELPGASNDENDCLRRLSKEPDSKAIDSGNGGSGDGDEDITERAPQKNEAFLSSNLGNVPQCVLPLSLGAEFSQLVAKVRDTTKDIVFTKTHYSAFNSGVLLQTLRSQFVTELFICGALTNISVYATAMDAARHGYTITLVDDCLGYRAKARHDEALRKLTEDTGCELMSSAEVIEKIYVKEKSQKQSPDSRRPIRDSRDRQNISELMSNLNLKEKDDKDCSTVNDARPQPTEARPSALEAKLADFQAEGPMPGSEDAPDTTPLIPPQRKPPGDERKRIQTKVRSRRRHSKSSVKDAEGPGLGSHKRADETQGTAKAPTPSTHTVAPEIRGTVSPKQSTDSNPLRTNPYIVPDNRMSSEADIQKEDETMAKRAKEKGRDQKTRSAAGSTERQCSDAAVSELGPVSQEKDYTFCEGDSMIIHDLLPESEAETIFERVRDEVRWQKMFHRGGEVPRLVAVQGEISEDGSIPIYRHPADESPPLLPFTPTVLLIKSVVEKRLGHKVNHCLIQLYRSGTDYISEHSDKTLDIAPNSFIANVSLGAMRSMTFRTKQSSRDPSTAMGESSPRRSVKAALPHNSMCKMGLLTNMKWLHSIRQDKRASREKSEAELAFEGCRISLTFRNIGTFLNRDQIKIWGQGATVKDKKKAPLVINGDIAEANRMLLAFGRENQSSEFNWDEEYGRGFDVLHISSARELFLSGDSVVNLRILLILAEYNLSWTIRKLSPFPKCNDGGHQVNASPISETLLIRLVDNDPSRARVEGDVAILLYLDASYSPVQEKNSQLQKAREYTRLQLADALLQKWRSKAVDEKLFRETLHEWDAFAAEDIYIAGPIPSVADYAFWPVLQDMLQQWGDRIECSNLTAYHDRMLRREAVQRAISSLKPIEVVSELDD